VTLKERIYYCDTAVLLHASRSQSTVTDKRIFTETVLVVVIIAHSCQPEVDRQGHDGLVCLNVGLFICGFSLMRLHFDQKHRCSCCCPFLAGSSSIASRKMSASGAPTNVAFKLSPTHLFTACSSAWFVAQIKHRQCHKLKLFR